MIDWKYVAKRFARRAYNWRRNFHSLGEYNVETIRERDQLRADLAAAQRTITQLREDAARVQRRLREAERFVRRVAEMGREVIQPTRVELHAIELTERWGCKTCGCTGGNGSWFVTDDKGRVQTTERCPDCRNPHGLASGSSTGETQGPVESDAPRLCVRKTCRHPWARHDDGGCHDCGCLVFVEWHEPAAPGPAPAPLVDEDAERVHEPAPIERHAFDDGDIKGETSCWWEDLENGRCGQPRSAAVHGEGGK